MKVTLNKSTKQYELECIPNPFTTPIAQETKFKSTNISCRSQWNQINVYQPDVLGLEHKLNMANISQDGESMFIRYNSEFLEASKNNYAAKSIHNIQASLKKENPDEPDLYCVSSPCLNCTKYMYIGSSITTISVKE